MKILERDCKARKREADRGSGISQEYREIDQMRKRLNRPKNQLRIETRRIKIKRQGRK